jgi:hypothetical protein
VSVAKPGFDESIGRTHPDVCILWGKRIGAVAINGLGDDLGGGGDGLCQWILEDHEIDVLGHGQRVSCRM